MLLLVMPTVEQEIKKILRSKINILAQVEAVVTLSTYRGLSRHNRHCTKRFNLASISSRQSVTISKGAECVLSSYIVRVGRKRRNTFHRALNEAYEKIAFWRKNLSMLRRKEKHQRSHYTLERMGTKPTTEIY